MHTCIVITGGLLILFKCFSILSSLKVLTCLLYLVVFFRSKATTTGSENLWEKRVRRRKPKSRTRLSIFFTFSAREKQNQGKRERSYQSMTILQRAEANLTVLLGYYLHQTTKHRPRKDKENDLYC